MNLPFMSSEVIISDLGPFWNQLGDLWKDGLKRLDCGLWKLGIDWLLEGDIVNYGLLEQHLLMLSCFGFKPRWSLFVFLLCWHI